MIAIITFLSLFLLTPLFNQPAAAQDTLQLQEYACNAPDPEAFKNCIEQVKQDATPFIKITKPFICDSREKCAFNLSGINSDLTIRAGTPQDIIFRSKDYSYSLFTINNTSNVKFIGIAVAEENKNTCIQGIVCPAVISIKDSFNLHFSSVNFKQTHGPSIAIADSSNITVMNSTFADSYKTAIEVSGQGTSNGLTIQNNLFEGNASNAVIFQGAADANKKSIITGNTFNNNHSKGVYTNCSYPCTGSQLRIVGPTTNLEVSTNTISGGQNTIFDAVGLYASGIEVGNKDMTSISLFCNEITGNRGSGIVQSPPFNNLEGISISENKIWGNGLNLNIPVATIDENNCYTMECKLSCQTPK